MRTPHDLASGASPAPASHHVGDLEARLAELRESRLGVPTRVTPVLDVYTFCRTLNNGVSVITSHAEVRETAPAIDHMRAASLT